jgi:alcohol dehydrogenase
VALASVPPFGTQLPVVARFGEGVLGLLPDALAELRVGRPGVVADPAVLELPAVRDVLAALAAGGREPLVHPIPAHEPTTASVDAAGARLAAAEVDGVVGIGGGSALDTAKGARLVAAQGRPVARFAWPGDARPIGPIGLPLVTVPTTAGTGSEVTGGVVMVDPHRRLKVAAPSPHNRAQLALVDPALTHGLPPRPTLAGGLDVVAQAVGAITATTATPVADALALEALCLARDALPAVVRDGADAGARSRMACASLMAGMAMNLSEVGTEHTLGHALGAVRQVPHGLAVGLMLPESLEHERRFVGARLERVADALGAPPAAGADGDGHRAVAAVRRLLADLGCPSLRELGVGDEDARPLADAALGAWIPVEPGPWSRDDVEAAFRRAIGAAA